MTSAYAQTVKIGLISTYSGPDGQYGPNIERGLKLYMKHHADGLPGGVKVELVVRDDGDPERQGPMEGTEPTEVGTHRGL